MKQIIYILFLIIIIPKLVQGQDGLKLFKNGLYNLSETISPTYVLLALNRNDVEIVYAKCRQVIVGVDVWLPSRAIFDLLFRQGRYDIIIDPNSTTEVLMIRPTKPKIVFIKGKFIEEKLHGRCLTW